MPGAQMLLDPREEQFDVPAALVERGNRQRRPCRPCRVGGQKVQRLACRWNLESDVAQMLGILSGRAAAVEHRPLIAHR